MNKLIFDKDTITLINYLVKHLFDDPTENYKSIPMVMPSGKLVSTVSEVADLLSVDTKTAAWYILQDPKVKPELKNFAKIEIGLGLYNPSDDSYDVILHKADSILSNVDYKRIRMVRTDRGVQKFRQKLGSIIVDDGQSPLDGLIALTNDIPGYEKIGDKHGNIFYVGKEKGEWVVRDPNNNSVIHKNPSPEEAYNWLNKYVGASSETREDSVDPKRGKSSTDPLDNDTSTTREREKIKDDVIKNITFTPNEALEIVVLNNQKLSLYARYRQRGLTHDAVMNLLVGKKKKK